MHDIDRTLMEYETETEEFEGDYEYDETEAVFDETEEMELAAELLEVSDEAELDQFLSGLLKKAKEKLGGSLKLPIGRALGGILKGAVKKVLPAAAGVAGTVFGGPVGGMAAGKLASTAGKLLGLELEGLSAEDQEFEAAKQVVRLAGEAVKNATEMPPGADPQQAAKGAAVQAAEKYAPGLVRAPQRSSSSPMMAGAAGRSGRWIRRGRRIILLGA